MMHQDPATIEAIALASGGVLGCAARALVSQSQDLISRKTIADLIIGGLVGIVYPLIAPIPIPSSGHANLIQQAAFVGIVSYVADHVLVNYFGKKIEAWVGKSDEDKKP